MSAAALPCDACGAAFPEAPVGPAAFVPCPVCGVACWLERFPAHDRPPEAAAAAESVREAGEAACFFHAGKRAAVSCDRCGVFLCALCDLPLGKEHLCPRCLETGVAKRKLPDLENHRFLHDRLALSLAVAPLLIFYFTLFTAPAAVFVALRFWNAPRSIVRPGRGRMIAALVIALLEIVAWIVAAAFLVSFIAKRRG